MKRFLLIGYFGANNLGDDIMLNEFLRYLNVKDRKNRYYILKSEKRKIYLDDDVNKKVKILDLSWLRYGKSYIYKYYLSRKFDGLIWIGGTCFTEREGDGAYKYMMSFNNRGKYTSHIGIGIGRIANVIRKKQLIELLSLDNFISFREENSYNKAREYCKDVKGVCCDDLVWLIADKIQQRKKINCKSEKSLLVSWRDCSNYVDYDFENRAITELLKFIKNKYNDFDIINIAEMIDGVDSKKNRLIYSKVKSFDNDNKCIYSAKLSTEKKIDFIQSASCCITGRLHCGFLSEMFNNNTIMIGYDEKTRYFLDSIGRLSDFISVEDCTVNKLMDAYDAESFISESLITNHFNLSKTNIDKFLDSIDYNE